ncbi:MAG: ABC transporter substrate-binding protein [SAR202 cluster bacterium]|nr:ABC transporter substrate-binding protein [SAR202 cluster bacterium]
MSIFFRLLALLSIFLLSLASACADNPSSNPASTSLPTATALPTTSTPTLEPGEYGGTLTLANRGDPPAAFDTMRTSSIALHHPGGALFGPGNLVKRCRENVFFICPDLAERWFPNADFSKWTFQIQRNAYWHDGTRFTADDAKFWLDLAVFGYQNRDRVRAPAYFKGELGDVKQVDVLPGSQLVVTLTGPSFFFPDKLTNPRLKIAHPKHLMQPRLEDGEVSVAPLDVGLVGAGPFKIEKYQKGSLISLRRFERYWEKDAQGRALPYLDGIDFVVIEDPAVMDAAFRSGRIDGGARGEGHYLTLERRSQYEESMKDRAYFGEIQGGQFRLAFNTLKPGPWQDVRVRKALSLWINKAAAIPSALGGQGVLTGLISPNNLISSPDFLLWPGYNKNTRDQDMAEAKRLLADAGYPNGFSMDHLCRNNTIARCEFLHGQLKDLNVNLSLRVVDEAEWNAARVTLDYDSQQGAFFSPVTPEATESVFGVFSNNPDSYAKHQDSHVTTLYSRLRDLRQERPRVEAWREIERYLVLEQAYVIPIAATHQVVPYRNHVRGVAIPAEDGHANTDFATAWLSR